jgi:hypothetical protein
MRASVRDRIESNLKEDEENHHLAHTVWMKFLGSFFPPRGIVKSDVIHTVW